SSFGPLARSGENRSCLQQHDEIAWVKFHRALEIRLRFLPARCPPIHRADVHINSCLVRQKPFGDLKLNERLIVVPEPVISVKALLPMNLSCVRLDLFGLLQGKSGQFAATIAVISASPIEIEV